jgi:DNA-binding transcriptional MerR regulator
VYSPETVNRIHQLRGKESDKTLTLEDMKEVVRLLREGRQTAAQTSTKSRAAKGPMRDPNAMLDELDSM